MPQYLGETERFDDGRVIRVEAPIEASAVSIGTRADRGTTALILEVGEGQVVLALPNLDMLELCSLLVTAIEACEAEMEAM